MVPDKTMFNLKVAEMVPNKSQPHEQIEKQNVLPFAVSGFLIAYINIKFLD